MTSSPKFVAFEGLDGSGKTTHVKRLASRLEKCGVKTWVTAEPTNSPIGQLIHGHMKEAMRWNEETVAGLFVADRLDHLLNGRDGICKKIAEGTTVLTDRYYFSSYAYHSVHVPMDWVIQANGLSSQILRPDLNIFIDVPPAVCFDRITSNRKHCQRYESAANLERVRGNYLAAFQRLRGDERVVVLDGDMAVDEVANNVWDAVSNLFGAIEEVVVDGHS